MLNTLLHIPIHHQQPLLMTAGNTEQVSDLLLLSFIPSKLYPLASPADSRKGTHAEHKGTYAGDDVYVQST